MSETSIAPEAVVLRNEDVLYSEVADGMSLMDIESGRYFHFEQTGARIWLELSEDKTFCDLCAGLEQEFDVETEQCREETEEFLASLLELGLATLRK
ncbi:PqqD family protein [Parerythrobacter lacustris]|uniref:PqqD family protein n=1 Tax=Parerythrobacter lacustris TaxID=2969984 RepID=A0ABT1XNF9_9SPHN|nr:PqqD family protein [Parerythrobacter lacustris]MCR2833196.1 PqqD family protein [Parerythrobacter lacustris]